MTSINRRKELNNDLLTKSSFKCNSFRRFGDELCQLLLTYLSISHKIRFEFVSK